MAGEARVQRPREWRAQLLAAALLGLFAAQCGWFIGTQSLTVDEPFHLLSGISAWRQGEFKLRDDNPPLPRLLFAFPVRGEEWQIVKPSGGPVEQVLPDPVALQWRTRPVTALLGVIAGALLWSAARSLFSASAANFALALFALSPALIAHFSLTTHDAPMALMALACAWQLIRWRRAPNWKQAALLGVAIGAMLATKHSAPPLAALAIALALILKPEGWRLDPRKWNWRAAILAMGVGLLTLWACYFFHVSRVTIHGRQMRMEFPNFETPWVRSMPLSGSFTFYVPAGEYLSGLVNVAKNSQRGFATYLLGESSYGGRRSFFPIVMALKWPTIVLLLAAGGALVMMRWRKWSERSGDLWVMLLFPAVYFGMAVTSNMNFGDRHILPVYPFLLLLAAALWHAAARRKRVYALVLIALVAVQAGDTARYAPDYLTYFNPFVNAEKSYELLTDSNLDWGQGLLALRKYQQAHPDERIHLAYFGNVSPQTVYGIRAEPFEDTGGVAGTVVISARHLSGYPHKNRWNYKWILKYPHREVLGHCLYVFDLPAGAIAPHAAETRASPQP